MERERIWKYGKGCVDSTLSKPRSVYYSVNTIQLKANSFNEHDASNARNSSELLYDKAFI